VSEVVGQGKTIATAMDWTDFDADDQTTLALNLVTNYDRATLLLWLTVLKDELKDKRNDYEDLCLARLAQMLPEGVAVTILADRGFGDASCSPISISIGWASPMSSAFAATFMSPRPMAERAPTSHGLGRVDERASCAT
jgi:hypothetical protein